MSKRYTYTFTQREADMLIDAIGEFELAVDPMDNDSTQYNGWDRRALATAKGKLLEPIMKEYYDIVAGSK